VTTTRCAIPHAPGHTDFDVSPYVLLPAGHGFAGHRLYVVDEGGVLVGVVTAFDVVRKLRREEADT
jgi:CBS domain-containing protein